MDEARALRSAALQAISSLQAVIDQATEQMHQLARVVDSTASPEVLLADPDNPANMQQALTRSRAELAAAREALTPFAHAWTRKLEMLPDLEIEVFLDPQRPERSKSIKARDLKRANQVLTSMTLGAELLDRLHEAETLLRQTDDMDQDPSIDDAQRMQDQIRQHFDKYGAALLDRVRNAEDMLQRLAANQSVPMDEVINPALKGGAF